MTPSASAVPRILACPTSATLPQHDYRSKYAEDGQDYHAEIEAAIDVGDESAIPDDILALIGPGDETITERAFAYDVATDTGRELAGVKRRAYGDLRPFEVPGTPDLVIRGERRLVVVDHKGHEEVTEAERNEQIATYALMVARAYGYDEVEVVIRYRAEWRRPTRAVLGSLELDAHAAKLRQMFIDVAAARKDPETYVRTGSHCRYCPAHLSCPRTKALQQQLGSGELEVVTEAAIPFANDDDAAQAWELLQRIKLLTTRISAALYARAAERPIPLPDGRMFGPVEKQGNAKLDGDVVYEVVKEKYGRDIADTAVTRSATQKRLKEALGFVGAKSVAAASKEVLAEVEKRGGLKRDAKTTVEVYEPQKLLKVVGQ